MSSEDRQEKVRRFSDFFSKQGYLDFSDIIPKGFKCSAQFSTYAGQGLSYGAADRISRFQAEMIVVDEADDSELQVRRIIDPNARSSLCRSS